MHGGPGIADLMRTKTFIRTANIYTTRCTEHRWRGPDVLAAPRPLPLLSCALACLIILASAAGCGGSSVPRAEEELVAEKALQAALGGERAEFVTLVAPSFLAGARAEMPDSSDETLGGVLIAGFLEDIPFTGMRDAVYGVESAGDKAAVYIWGIFLDPSGVYMEIGEAEAVRIPLVRENGRWYIDLLDL